MKTPVFWNSANALSTLLLPLSWIYSAGHALRWKLVKPVTLPVPVICIGNATAGGAGKTPVAIAVGEYFKKKKIDAFFLSRGYGGKLRGPILVDARHSAADVGDEPLLLARMLPTVVAKDRLAGARFAIKNGAKVIVMDDGFQNPHVAKQLSLLVADGLTAFGNERIIPAGPLRETLASALSRAQAAIIINRGDRPVPLPATRPVLIAKTVPAEQALSLKGKKVLAFCGIAYPQKFTATLHAIGADVVDTISFPDHHPYSNAELEALKQRAQKAHAVLVTTAKDAVRLSDAQQRNVTVVDIVLSFDNAAALAALLDTVAA